VHNIVGRGVEDIHRWHKVNTFGGWSVQLDPELRGKVAQEVEVLDAWSSAEGRRRATMVSASTSTASPVMTEWSKSRVFVATGSTTAPATSFSAEPMVTTTAVVLALATSAMGALFVVGLDLRR
jgi:hypothetical protein